MWCYTANGLQWSDASSSSSSSSSSASPNPFPQSPIRLQSAQFFHRPPAPDVPSTFLPSYYPEGRYASLDRDLNLSGNGTGYASPNHSPATWEALSQGGPSSRHLLDGTNIIEPHPPRARGKEIGREMRPPEYRISPASIASSLINKAAATSGTGSGSGSFPMDPALQNQSNSGSGSGNPHGNDSGGGGGGGGGGRYHPYSHPIQRSSSGTGTGGGGGSGPSRNNTTIPEPAPNSTAYPGNMYTNIPLPERPDLEPWERMGAGVEITGEDYAQALEIYQHLLEAVPSMRAHNDYPPLGGGQRYEHLVGLASDGLSYLSGPPQAQMPPQATPQPPNPEPASVPLNPSSSSNSNKRSAHNMNGDKKTPKCLGCGATETPEWRRGPMGPRTLCNACGLVHMKLQRKRRRELEKETVALEGR